MSLCDSLVYFIVLTFGELHGNQWGSVWPLIILWTQQESKAIKVFSTPLFDIEIWPKIFVHSIADKEWAVYLFIFFNCIKSSKNTFVKGLDTILNEGLIHVNSRVKKKKKTCKTK